MLRRRLSQPPLMLVMIAPYTTYCTGITTITGTDGNPTKEIVYLREDTWATPQLPTLSMMAVVLPPTRRVLLRLPALMEKLLQRLSTMLRRHQQACTLHQVYQLSWKYPKTYSTELLVYWREMVIKLTLYVYDLC